MDSLLLLAYLGAISVFVLSVAVVALRGTLLFPRKQFLLLLAYFGSWVVGLIILLDSELNAPYSSHFYQNPFLFTVYIGILGLAMCLAFWFVADIQLGYLPKLSFVGVAFLVATLVGVGLTLASLLASAESRYPWGFYLAAESAMILGIVTFALLGWKSFQDSTKTERISREVRWGLITLGTLSVFAVVGLMVYAIGIPFADFSVAFPTSLTIWWLYWMGGSSLVMLVMIQRTYRMLVPRRDRQWSQSGSR